MQLKVSLTAAVLASAICAASAADSAPSVSAPARAVVGSKYMVATANARATDAAAAVLADGGSAADAVVAAALVLNIVEPQSIGIGGGGYLLYADGKSGKLTAYDAREAAPAAVTTAQFSDASGKPLGDVEISVGGRAIGVPGTLSLLETLHKSHGKLPWSRLFAPAIKMAEEGFEVSPLLAGNLAAEKTLGSMPGTKAYFLNGDGTPRAAGTRLKNPEFAAALRLIAAKGADVFYKGEIADDIVRAMQQNPAAPGVMTKADLANYKVQPREALCMPYHGHRVCGMPPSSSGGTAVLQMLGMLDTFDMRKVAPNSAQSVHLITDSARLAFADRARYLADSAFVPYLPGLISTDYLSRRAKLLDGEKALAKAEPGVPSGAERLSLGTDPLPRGLGSSQVSVVDAAGNAVSMTLTIGSRWGSRTMVRGFLLNDEIKDFTFPDRDAKGELYANRIEPGKRPRSSMAPTMVFAPDGKLKIVTGSSGGSYIISFVTKNLVAMLDWGMDPQEAINLPNMVSIGGPAMIESGTSLQSTEAALKAMGHEVKVDSLQSGVGTVVVDGKRLLGAADPRKEGSAVGR